VRRLIVFACAAALSLVLAPTAFSATKSVNMGTPLKAQKQFGKYQSDANAFFPSAITIHAGDSIKFVPTGFHNVDIPAKGGKPAEALLPSGTVSGSLDAAGSPFWFNGAVPNVGFNPVVVVGSLGKKVTYTGAKAIQSGLPLSAKPKPMTVKFPKAGSYTYYCDLHPGMKASVRVVATSKRIPTAAQDAKRVEAQVAQALTIAKGLTKATLPANTVTVGNAGAHGVEYFGFLPATLNVPAGTTVKFQMSAKSLEIHTATAGPGDPEKEADSYLGKLAKSFEAPVVDPAAAYPSDPPSAPASLTAASHGNGFWNSGVLDALSATPQLPGSSSVTFAAAGTYKLYCLVHPFMVGTVVVS
jgi:plastocyanin